MPQVARKYFYLVEFNTLPTVLHHLSREPLIYLYCQELSKNIENLLFFKMVDFRGFVPSC